jgi:hypothetical protein
MGGRGMNAAERDRAFLLRVGGLAGLLLGIGYVATIPVYAAVGVGPEGGGAWLAYGAGKTTEWWAILGLQVFTDVMYVPLAFALYFALKEVGRSAMLLAASFLLLFVALDLAVTWTNYAVLITLSSAPTAATPAQLGAAEYASAVINSPVLGLYAVLVPAMGILIASVVMLRGTLSRVGAYLGVLTGVAGVVTILGRDFVPALAAGIILTSLLTTAWALVVGFRLFRLGRADLTYADQPA